MFRRTYDPRETESTIIIFDEAGNEYEFELLDGIDYLGKQYIVMIGTDDDDDEAVIVEVVSSSDKEELFAEVQNPVILDAVFTKFKENNSDIVDPNATVSHEAPAGPVKVRSRLGLWFIAWLSAFAGGHLNWLGYKEEGEAWRREHGVIGAVLSPACWIYHIVEQVAILFGKYRTDAYGNPIRYASHLRNLNKKK